MKKFYLLTKTLLVAALLMVGANAWAKSSVWSENFESTTIDALKSAWTGNDGDSWGTTYSPTLELQTNKCNNSTTWFNTYSPTLKRQSTAYYYFNSAYTGHAYQFDAKLNLNIGSDSGESRFYFMNGSKTRYNEDPTNYLFYIGVNTSGYVYISNGTDSQTSTIGGLTSGTNSIAATLASKTYKSTGWFDASCIIDFEQNKVTVTLNSATTLTVSLKSGTEQISGFAVRNGTKYYGVVAMDDMALYELTYPAFTLSDDSKIVPAGGSRTVSVTGITGTISGVSSSNTSVATASYDAGTVTINGVAKGNTTITVTGTNDGLTIQKTIDVEVRTYGELYEEAKEEYGTQIDALDAAGQAYWESNTSSSGVTDEASYNTAVADLPTTYVAAVKAQTTAGSNMTDAVENANCETLSDWGAVTAWSSTSDQFHGNSHSTDVAQISTPFAESWVYTGSDPAAVLADQTISHTAISGLSAGVYRVTGFIRAASEGSHASETPTGFSLYANSETSSTTEGISSAAGLVYGTYSVEVTLDGTEDLTFGIEVKDANFNWVAFKNFTLTYLGAEKKTYTINAVAGETVIKELATGSEWPSDTYGVYVPKVILYNSKYYVLDDPNMSNYYASYIMGATDVTKEINYTLDENIVAFTDGTGGYRKVVKENNASYSSGDVVDNSGNSNYTNARNRGFSLGTLSAGIYCMEAYVVNSTKGRAINLRDNNSPQDPIVAITNSSKITGLLTSSNFQLASNTELVITGSNNTDGGSTTKSNLMEQFDYVLIRKATVPVTISSYGWATFSSDYALDFTSVSDFEAYMITGHEGSVVTKTQVTGTVPAGTGLLLKGDEGSYTVPVVGSSSTDVSGNKLVAGTGEDVSYEEGDTKYVLGVSDGDKAEFQKIVDGTPATVAKGKAYLWFKDESLARTMSFEGDKVTGISEAKPEVDFAKEGKFVEGGKLVIFKKGMKFNANGARVY